MENHQKFDLTCTATLRPELLDITLSTFTKNFFRERISCARLIINIDMAGVEEEREKQEKYQDVLSIIEKYPFYEKEIRVGNDPHFPTAFCWCMSELENEYFFHLEEDWRMLIPLDFEEMWTIFSKYETLAHLRLSQFKSEEKECKNWNKFLPWNGEFFEVKEEEKGVIGWAGHPSLNRSSFMKECLKYIDPMVNPEKQIKGRRYTHPMNEILSWHRFGSYHPQNSAPAIMDIGRNWMIQHGWIKEGSKAFFTNWIKEKKDYEDYILET